MALSPQQITQERDEAFQKKVEACEREIDALLRRHWNNLSDYEPKRVLDISEILRQYNVVFHAVVKKYELAGWEIKERPVATYGAPPRYEIQAQLNDESWKISHDN